MAAKFKPPASLAACTDLLYKLRQERLAADKVAAELKSRETALVEHLIATLPKSKATGISGKFANAKIEMKTTVNVTDWDKLYAYIVKNAKKGGFALLQRRVSISAVEEMWNAKKVAPGCEPFRIPTISLTKR